VLSTPQVCCLRGGLGRLGKTWFRFDRQTLKKETPESERSGGLVLQQGPGAAAPRKRKLVPLRSPNAEKGKPRIKAIRGFPRIEGEKIDDRGGRNATVISL